MVAALDISLGGIHNSCPVCSYMGQEVVENVFQSIVSQMGFFLLMCLDHR